MYGVCPSRGLVFFRLRQQAHPTNPRTDRGLTAPASTATWPRPVPLAEPRIQQFYLMYPTSLM
jgi:hypothetical protein